MPLEIIGYLGLQMVAGLRPFVQEFMQPLDGDEQMRRCANLGLRAGERADRVDQIGRAVGAAAFFAIIAVLIR